MSRFKKVQKVMLSAVLIFSAVAHAAEIQVGPAESIKTLQAARNAVRALRASGEKGDVDVIIQDGRYALDETLIFSLKDSAPAGAVTRYRAADGAHPVVSGGRVIEGWKKSELAGGKIWVADVSWARGDAFFHCLFDGGKPLQRAQSGKIKITNKGNVRQYTAPLKQRVEFTFPSRSLKNWDNLGDLELYGSPTRKWMVNFLTIKSVNPGTGKGMLATPATYLMSGNFVVENCIDHLDTPGEWVLNSKEGKLYYWPKSGTPGNQVTAPVLNELIRVEGVNDSSVAGTQDQPVEGIVFQGLEFLCADRQQWLPEDKGIQHDWNMWDKANGLIRFRGARNCAVKNCTFANSGSDGVRLDLFCQNITIEDSIFRDLGGTGVLLAGYGPGKKDVNKNNTIRNNEITRVGNLFLHSPGVFVWQSGHNQIANNHIYDQAYTGLVVSGVRRRFFNPIFKQMGKGNPFKKWIFDKDTREHSSTIRWDEITLGDIEAWASYEPYMHSRGNVIEFNEIHDCLKLLHDGNCIYLSGNGDGNIVRHNVAYNHPEGAMIRTDDDSHGTTIQGNLLFGTTGNQGLTIKGLNTATDNMLVNCQMLTGRAGNPVDPNATLARNIFYHTTTKLSDGFHYGLETVGKGLDYNLYSHDKAGVAKSQLDVQRKKSRTKKSDLHSQTGNPMFVDARHGNFDLKAGSPALALGIQPLTLETVQQMGTSNDPFLKRFAEGMPMNVTWKSSAGAAKKKGKKGKKRQKPKNNELGQLANQGMRFDRAYVANSICAPSFF